MLIFATFLIIFRKFCGLRLVLYNSKFCHCFVNSGIRNNGTVPAKHVFYITELMSHDLFYVITIIFQCRTFFANKKATPAPSRVNTNLGK